MEHMADIPMDDKHLAQFGENTARAMVSAGTMSGRQTRHEVKDQLNSLCATRDHLSKSAVPTQPAQWLLDNWYLAQREAAEAAASFRRAGRLRAVRNKKKTPPLYY